MNIAVAGQPITSSVNAQTPRAITIAIVAMGGEGGGVLADWIVDLAEHGAYLAQTTSVLAVVPEGGGVTFGDSLLIERGYGATTMAAIGARAGVPGCFGAARRTHPGHDRDPDASGG